MGPKASRAASLTELVVNGTFSGTTTAPWWNGSNGEWCNPGGRKLGTPSQVGGGAELLLWAKVPGDSDGQCGIAPGTPAGQFSPDLAIRLIDGT